MQEVQTIKIELFKEEVQKLLTDFGEKRNKYKKQKNNLQILLACLGGFTSVCISLSFIDEITLICKIIGIVLSSLTTIVAAILNIYDYEGKWKQRTITYLKLLELKRDFKLEMSVSVEKFTEYKKRLNQIMKEDAELWSINANTQKRKTLVRDEEDE